MLHWKLESLMETLPLQVKFFKLVVSFELAVRKKAI